MKPAFLLMCYLSGMPSGQTHFADVNSCNYFKKSLSNQAIKIGEDEKYYDCYCKLVIINEKRVKLY
tara:strand:- start:892 stop:1089 length:198 start_codon:yes stop_codon:yes gene_type:complete